MVTLLNLNLLLAFITLSASSNFSLKGDRCSKLDRCSSKSASKTCSCDGDCPVYGTCCHDIGKTKDDLTLFRCYSRRTISPVFAKRSCLDEYRGHVSNRLTCVDDDEDEMDVKNNLLVTNPRTKVTYWNSHCALCNNEVASNLDFWDIVVYCPSHKAIDRYLIRKNLAFDQDRFQWGLVIGDEFIQCFVRYSAPAYLDEVKHCTPNVIADCPADYRNEAVSTKCSQYYAERKLKNSDTYYKNVHCAMCNGVDVKDLECPGTSGREDGIVESGFRDMVEEFFPDGEWLEKEPGKLFECSRGFVYDPFREKCRTYENEEVVMMIPSSAHVLRKASLVILAPFLTLLFKMVVSDHLFTCQQSV